MPPRAPIAPDPESASSAATSASTSPAPDPAPDQASPRLQALIAGYANPFELSLRGVFKSPPVTKDPPLMERYEDLTFKIQYSYCYVPMLFASRARVLSNMGFHLLALGDIIRAIWLCQWAMGVSEPPQHISKVTVIENMRKYAQATTRPGSTAEMSAMDPISAGKVALMIYCNVAWKMYAPLKAMQARIDEFTKQIERFEGSNGTFIPKLREKIKNTYAQFAKNAEISNLIDTIQYSGHDTFSLWENQQFPGNIMELARNPEGLEQINLYMSSLGKEFSGRNDIEGIGRNNKARKVAPAAPSFDQPVHAQILTPQPSHDGSINTEFPAAPGETAQTREKAPQNTQVGMVAFRHIVKNDIISKETTDLCVTDTCNWHPPYCCAYCFTLVKIAGLKQRKVLSEPPAVICCVHSKDENGQGATPTLYCNDQCQFKDRFSHRFLHQSNLQDVFVAAREHNFFPLFVTQVYTTIAGRSGQPHPLTLGPLKSTLETYGPASRRAVSLLLDLIVPWEALLEMGYDIFSDRRCDTWVLVSLKNKFLNHGILQNTDTSHTAMFATRALYNHSCEPNATTTIPNDQIPPPEDQWGRPNTLWVWAMKDIPIGAEVTISYLPDLKPDWSYTKRTEALKTVGIYQCWCLLCQKDRRIINEWQRRQAAFSSLGW